MADSFRLSDEEDDDAYEQRAASLAQTAFAIAFQLQAEEVQNEAGPSDLSSIAPSSEERLLGFPFRNLELSLSRRKAVDLRRSISPNENLHHQDLCDANFAIDELNESSRDGHGDFCKDPYESDSRDGAPPVFKVYASSVASSGSTSASFGIGAVVMDANNIVLTEIQKPMESGVGKAAADYAALIAGLEALLAVRSQRVSAFIDSVPVYNQVKRRWKVRSRRLQALCSQVIELAQKFEEFNAKLVTKRENGLALRLAREVLNFQVLSQTEEGKNAAEIRQICPICLEGKREDEMLHVSGCSHAFCLSCIVKHAEVKIQAGQVPIRCPHVSCVQTLSLSQCQLILSPKWFELCNKRIIEVNMPEAERVYCPFPNCSSLMNRKDLLAHNDAASTSLTSVTPIRCTECLQLFCAECCVPWHSSMSCEQYQKLPPNMRDAEDAKLYQLAEHQKWQRCKKCRRMIELAEGCYHITCRCGHEFCYTCGEPWKNNRQSCRCRLWDEDFLLENPLQNSDDDETEDSEGSLEESEDDSEDEWEGSEQSSEEYSEDSEDSEEFSDSNTGDLVNRSRPVHENRYYKTKLCKFWKTGCFWGKNCKFAHGVSELRAPLEESDDKDEWEGSDESSEDFEDDSEDSSDLNSRSSLELSAPVHNNPYYKTRLCKFWEKGCFWGKNCQFAHGVSELRVPAHNSLRRG